MNRSRINCHGEVGKETAKHPWQLIETISAPSAPSQFSLADFAAQRMMAKQSSEGKRAMSFAHSPNRHR